VLRWRKGLQTAGEAGFSVQLGREKKAGRKRKDKRIRIEAQGGGRVLAILHGKVFELEVNGRNESTWSANDRSALQRNLAQKK